MSAPKFTPTQQRLFDVLKDGMRHTRQELALCINDDMAELKTLRTHISNLRKPLERVGLVVAYVGPRGKGGWQLFHQYVPDDE